MSAQFLEAALKSARETAVIEVVAPKFQEVAFADLDGTAKTEGEQLPVVFLV